MLEYGKNIVSFPFGNIDQLLMRSSSESVSKWKWHHIDFNTNKYRYCTHTNSKSQNGITIITKETNIHIILNYNKRRAILLQES